jgi:hypothetical protein
VVAVALAAVSSYSGAADEEGFTPLFNGKDLSGWVNVNCAPETFSVRDGLISSTGIPTGILRTQRQYENFILELQWRHLKEQGNAGLFVWSDPLTAPGTPFARAIEVQILDGRNSETYTSHGDVFSIHGARMKPDRPHPNGSERCLPSEQRCKPAGEWNHYRVVCNDGALKLSVNGKEVSGGTQCRPRKGYICLESEGSPAEFRNIRIKELPSTNPTVEETTPVLDGFVPIYTGVDLRNFKHDSGHVGHWQPKNWVLTYDGKSEARDKSLWTEKEYGDFVLVCDWRLSATPKPLKRRVILPNGDYAVDAEGKVKQVEIMSAGDSGLYLRGDSKNQINIFCDPIGSGEVYGYRIDPKMPPEVRAGCTPKERADNPMGKWNRFVVTMKGDRLTVVLNGKTVIDNAQLPGIDPRGPIALQHHGDSLEFANLLIKEL